MRPSDSEFQTARDIIWRRASALAKTVEFRDLGSEELEQLLIEAVLERWSSYDADRSRPATFVRHLINHAVVDLRRHRRAAKRDIRRETQLPKNQEGMAQEYEGAQVRERRGIPSSDAIRDSDLGADVRIIVSQLPPDLAVLAELLTTHTPAEIVRRTGIPRSSLYTDIRRLRTAFGNGALDEYL